MSSCVGGLTLDQKTEYWCPGREWKRGAMFAAIMLPILCVGCVIYVFLRRRGVDFPTFIRTPSFAKPRFLSGLARIRVPRWSWSWIRRGSSTNYGYGYTRVNQDEPMDVLMEDYDSDDMDM
ncbi:hypothetical protein K7432_014405 [Basidiobolus ranarum]|uniref:Uncharacterized protein n=1 Tax=Basidiobolus ranarum TaxID=34480 RepID=A0ABR2WHP0_9FUNG